MGVAIGPIIIIIIIIIIIPEILPNIIRYWDIVIVSVIM